MFIYTCVSLLACTGWPVYAWRAGLSCVALTKTLASLSLSVSLAEGLQTRYPGQRVRLVRLEEDGVLHSIRTLLSAKVALGMHGSVLILTMFMKPGGVVRAAPHPPSATRRNSLSLSLTHKYSRSCTHTRCLIHSLTHIHTLFLSVSLSHSRTHTYIHSHTPSFSLSVDRWWSCTPTLCLPTTIRRTVRLPGCHVWACATWHGRCVCGHGPTTSIGLADHHMRMLSLSMYVGTCGHMCVPVCMCESVRLYVRACVCVCPSRSVCACGGAARIGTRTRRLATLTGTA
jgi:hypothetical protein